APAGSLIRQPILSDSADGQRDDPLGVVASGGSQVGAVGGEIPAAFGAVVLRIGQDDIGGPPRGEGSEVVEGPLKCPVAVGAMAAPRAGPTAAVAAARADSGPGQVLDAGDALGGIGQVVSGSWQGVVLL